MNSMENFFNWVSKPVLPDEVLIWFNINNMNYEKIQLYGDFFKSLNFKITDTYFEEESYETKITMSEQNKKEHFLWCWKEIIEDFKKENINFKLDGEHKDYFEKFYNDTFYNVENKKIKDSIPEFLEEVFDLSKPFSKSDLEIMTEIYKILEKNIE